MPEYERKRVINDLYSVKVSITFLYVTPEQAATDFFKVGSWSYSLMQIVVNFICLSHVMIYTLFTGFIVVFST